MSIDRNVLSEGMRMGDWGAKAWESDEAADWFHRFWKEGWALVEQEIEAFDPAEERFESLRAAAHVLESFGNPFMAPTDFSGKLAGWLERSEEILRAMIDPNDRWGFREMCTSDPTIVAAVEDQIGGLRKRRLALTRS